jgi:hypothetical protein
MYIMFMRVGRRHYDIENGIVSGYTSKCNSMGLRRDSLAELHQIAAEHTEKLLSAYPRQLVTVRIAKYI